MKMIVRDESLSGAGTNLWHQNPFFGSLHWQEPAPGSVAGLQEASVHSCLKITPTTTFLCCWFETKMANPQGTDKSPQPSQLQVCCAGNEHNSVIAVSQLNLISKVWVKADRHGQRSVWGAGLRGGRVRTQDSKRSLSRWLVCATTTLPPSHLSRFRRRCPSASPYIALDWIKVKLLFCTFKIWMKANLALRWHMKVSLD